MNNIIPDISLLEQLEETEKRMIEMEKNSMPATKELKICKYYLWCSNQEIKKGEVFCKRKKYCEYQRDKK